jgi:hypothetical protein
MALCTISNLNTPLLFIAMMASSIRAYKEDVEEEEEQGNGGKR